MLAQPVEDEEAALRILDVVDLGDCHERHPLSLSGGQKQRVAVAAALACGRRIVVFDEPTIGLDMGHMRRTAELIRGLANEGRAVVVVTHDPEFALLSCDWVIEMDRGAVRDSYPMDGDGARRVVGALVARIAEAD